MAQKPETAFRKKVDKFLDTLQNCVHYSIQQRSIMGHPDKMVCISGVFLALEIKAEEGEPRPLQKLILDAHEGNGMGASFVVQPSNFEELKKLLIDMDGWSDIRDLIKQRVPSWRKTWQKS